MLLHVILDRLATARNAVAREASQVGIDGRASRRPEGCITTRGL
ncbi:hypothetical protein [Acidithiobacillus ferrooxidans]|nr:hypothetical protein [Acidithiobacillus ferrooxidans]